MSKQLKVISINFRFENREVVHQNTLATENALFDFDVVVIRPERFNAPPDRYAAYQGLEAMIQRKRAELSRLFAQGCVLVVFLDVPDTYSVNTGGGYSSGTVYSVNNYEFLDRNFIRCLQIGKGEQISYSDSAEPFAVVLKESAVAWTTYVATTPEYPFNNLRFFASGGVRAAIAGKMPMGDGHLILLPNVEHLEESLFFDACREYRYRRHGSVPPSWVEAVFLPGLSPIESKVAGISQQILDLELAKEQAQRQLDERSAYRKLLYEKGKVQLEPIVLRALDDLDFATTSGEIIGGTIYEIDGRTSTGSMTGIVEVKGSKKQIALSEFSPFVLKILADCEANVASKGILVGNGLCEDEPQNRLHDVVFSNHVIDAAKRNSVALINSVELYWLCSTLLDGGSVDKQAVRETILSSNGYVDLKPFCGKSPWTAT